MRAPEPATQFFAFFLLDPTDADPLPRTGQLFWSRAAAREYVKTHNLPVSLKVRRAKILLYRS